MLNLPYIVSDLDGVLVDLVGEACYWFWQRFRVVVPPEAISTFEITDSIYELVKKTTEIRYGHPFYSKEDFQAEVRSKLWQDPAVYMRAKPHFTLWRALLEWPNNRLLFATNRPQAWGIRHATQDWLALHGFGEDQHELHFCHPDCAKKDVIAAVRQTLVNARVDSSRVIFIEDNQAEATQVHQSFPDIDVVLVERPWVALRSIPGEPSKLQVMHEQALCNYLRRVRDEGGIR